MTAATAAAAVAAAAVDRQKLLPLLQRLSSAVEEVLLTGLAAASESTRQAFNVVVEESARLRLLRLASTLRAANEELGRFTRNETDFSRSNASSCSRACWFVNVFCIRSG